jgi:hypothetical protein
MNIGWTIVGVTRIKKTIQYIEIYIYGFIKTKKEQESITFQLLPFVARRIKRFIKLTKV